MDPFPPSVQLLSCSCTFQQKKGQNIGYGVFTLPDTDADADADTAPIGFQTDCVGAGTSVGKGKICVDVAQCEHTISVPLGVIRDPPLLSHKGLFTLAVFYPVFYPV